MSKVMETVAWLLTTPIVGELMRAFAQQLAKSFK
jgi:hypothetical protein